MVTNNNIREELRIVCGIITLLGIMLLSFEIAAAVPVEEWNRTFSVGLYGDDYIHSVQQTTDGGYIIGGVTYDPYPNDPMIQSTGWFKKIDNNGSVQWSKVFNYGRFSSVENVQQTMDGGYVYVISHADNLEVAFDVDKIDTFGNVLTLYSTEGGNYYTGGYVQQTTDSGYIIIEISGPTHATSRLIKIDETGNEQWNKTYSNKSFLNVQQTADGGFIIRAFNWLPATYELVKTDAYGNVLWNKPYKYNNIRQCADGGYILIGSTTSSGAGGSDACMIKTDAFGNHLWNKIFGGTIDDYGEDIQQTTDGGYIIAGWSGSTGYTYAWSIKTDSSGNQQWKKTFGGDGYDYFKFVQQTTDGGYIVAGHTNSYGAGDYDAWLVKVKDVAASPLPSFTHTTTGLTASFTSTSHDPDGYLTAHNWDFGDGKTSSAENPTQTYAISADYDVTLTVTDNDGYKNSKTETVSVGDDAITRVSHPSDIPFGTELSVEVETNLETDITLDFGTFQQTLHGRDVIFNIDTTTLTKSEHTLTVTAGSDTYTDSIIIYDPAIYQKITKGLDDLSTCSKDEMREISGKTGLTLTNHIYTILLGVELEEDVTVEDMLNNLRSQLGEVSEEVTTQLETFKTILINTDPSISSEVDDMDPVINSITNIRNEIKEVDDHISDEKIVESINEYVTKPAVYRVICADEENSIDTRTQITKSGLDPYYTQDQLDETNEILSIGKEAISNTDGEQIYRLYIGTVLGHEISVKPTLDYLAEKQIESINPPDDMCFYDACIPGKYNPVWVYHLTVADAESLLTIPAYIGWIDATPEDEIVPPDQPRVAPAVYAIVKAVKAYMKYVDMLEKFSPWMIDGGMIISTDLLAKEVDEEHTDVIDAIQDIIQSPDTYDVISPAIADGGLYVPKGNILITTSPDGKIRNFKYARSDSILSIPVNKRVISLNTDWSESFKSETQNISISIAVNRSGYNTGETVNLTVNISSDTYIEDAMLWIFAPESNTTIKDIFNVTTGDMSRNYNFTIQNETWHVPRVYLTNFGTIFAENYTSFGVGSETCETGIITIDYDEFYDPDTVSLNVTIHNSGNISLNSRLEYFGSHPDLTGSIEMSLLQAGEQTTEQLTFDLTTPDVYEMYFILNSSDMSSGNGTLDYNTARFTVTARDTLLAFPSTDKPIYNASEGVNIAVMVKNVTLDIVSFPYSLKTTTPSGETTSEASFTLDYNGTYIVKATPIAEGYCVVEGETLFIVEKQSSLEIETETLGNTTTIIVKTDLGGVVEGADVIINGYTSKTNETGMVEFGSFNTTQLIIHAEKFGFNPIVTSVNLSNGIVPNIISFTPTHIVNDIEGVTRKFNITIDQIVNVSWLINGSEVFNQTTVNESSYTNISAAAGYWNVSAVVTNPNGTAMQTWWWNVKHVSIDLYNGWNLISLPLMPDDSNVNSVLSPISGNYSIVWAYNASDTSDHWKKYDSTTPFGNDLISMEPGKGYWIMMTSDDTLPISGTMPASTDIELWSGWNLIGYNSLNPQTITDALSSIDGNYSIIWAYNASDLTDHWKKYDPNTPFGNDLANMEPGKGYWIMMNTDDILNFIPVIK